MEIILLHLTVLQRTLTVERGRQTINKRPLDLRFNLLRIHCNSTVGSRHYAMHIEAAPSSTVTSAQAAT